MYRQGAETWAKHSFTQLILALPKIEPSADNCVD
jgi:hypothetical protein